MKRIFFLSIIFIGGCAYRTPPVNAPVANEITVEADDAEVRAEVEQILRAAKHHENATVHVKVVKIEETNGLEQAMHRDGFAAFAAPALLFGLAHQRATIAVDVSIGDRTTRGCAVKDGSIYAPARKRALAVALDRALAR